jgi:hypothetical protein
MKYADVGANVRLLLEDLPSQDEFIYELLLAYGKPKASITRLKQGTYNQSKVPGEVLWKKEVYFKAVPQAARLPDLVDVPAGLREAHHNLDLAVDRIYRAKPFTSDEERLEHLFKLYEEMTAKEKLV